MILKARTRARVSRKQPFGFSLPHGLVLEDENAFAAQIRKCHELFNQIERGFRDSENLPMDKLWLDDGTGWVL